MNASLLAAAGIIVAVGAAHSYLGERYILIRLFRREDLPRLFGSDVFTRRTLRMAWHLTTVVWWGVGALLALLAGSGGAVSAEAVGTVLSATCLVSAVVSLGFSRGRHLAWLAFAVIGVLCWLGTR